MKRIFWLLFALVCYQTAIAEEVDLPEGLVLDNPWDDLVVEEINESNYLSPQKNTEESPAISILEAHPSSIIHNCVNAVTGNFFESQIDLVVPGPLPLVVQRTYSSADKKWHFQHLPELEAGPSKHGRHLMACYRDDTGSGMLYQAGKGGTKLVVPSSVYKNGLTNCGAEEISGQTNWKNSFLSYVKTDIGKMYLLHHGTLVNRLFSRYKKHGKHKGGAPCGEFHLFREFHPNGNRLHYTYSDEDELQHVKALNKKGRLLGELKRSEDGCKWKASCGEVNYSFDKKMLTSAISPNALPATYNYDSNYLVRKNLPDGRYLKIDYYKGRVYRLQAPVGHDETAIPIYTFAYEKGETKVRDAEGLLTTYSYDADNKQLNQITKYNRNGQVLTMDTYLWAHAKSEDRGNSACTSF